MEKVEFENVCVVCIGKNQTVYKDFSPLVEFTLLKTETFHTDANPLNGIRKKAGMVNVFMCVTPCWCHSMRSNIEFDEDLWWPSAL